MATKRANVYLGRNNSIDLILKVNETAQNLSGVTHMEAILGGVTLSSAISSGYFTWTGKAGESATTVGWTRLTFGRADVLSPGVHDMELIVYDVGSTSGVYWGSIPVRVVG